MRRLLIFTLPEYGHLAPTLAISAHYASQGCEVVYLTLPKFSPKVEAAGGHLIPLLLGGMHGSGQQVWTLLAPQGSPGERGRTITERLNQVIADAPFDLVLLDWLLVFSMGCNIKEALGSVPCVLFSATLLPWKSRPVLQHDCPLLVLCPGELEAARFRDLPPSAHYVEPSYDPTPFGAPPLPLSLTGRYLVLVAWGSQSVRYTGLPLLLANIARLAPQRPDCLFVVATGSNPAAKAALANLPASNLVVCEDFEQQTLLQNASAILTHGGMSTIKECVRYQVPMLVFPFLTDQPLNAMRIAQAGIGSALFPEDQTLTRIAAELDRALSGEFGPNLERLRQTFVQRESDPRSHRFLDPFLT